MPKQQEPSTKIRPFLKWAGNKLSIMDHIHALLPPGKRLIEPFAGSAAVFLNTQYDSYLVNDINADLITLYQTLQTQGQEFIDYCQQFFTAKYNQEKIYYRLRKRFNACDNAEEKSALFLYLNRHGYNGLCRYNQSNGEFNVPFGRYTKPYFPAKEMLQFYHKAKQATFICQDFKSTMQRARRGHVIYCDPPYVPLNATANFTHYSRFAFGLEQQQLLATTAEQLFKRGVHVLLSNHDTELTRKLYHHAEISYFDVKRTISCKGKKRKPARELLALFS